MNSEVLIREAFQQIRELLEMAQRSMNNHEEATHKLIELEAIAADWDRMNSEAHALRLENLDMRDQLARLERERNPTVDAADWKRFHDVVASLLRRIVHYADGGQYRADLDSIIRTAREMLTGTPAPEADPYMPGEQIARARHILHDWLRHYSECPLTSHDLFEATESYLHWSSPDAPPKAESPGPAGS